MDRHWAISAKGILWREEGVLLAANDRQEWELPGGHVEPGESPEEAVIREWREETGLTVRVDRLVDAAFYTPLAGGRSVFLVFYTVQEDVLEPLTLSEEHQALVWVRANNLPANLPDVYRRAIGRAGDGTVMHRVAQLVAERTLRDGESRMRRLQTREETPPRIGVGE